MKNIIKKKISYEQEIVESIKCEICKKKYKGKEWEAEGVYDVLETEIRYKYGDSYPEGGSGKEIEFDICPRCFKEELMPLLEKKFNANFTEDKWDY